MARRTLIVGAGYVGRQLARALKARGDAVTAWVRSSESAAELREENFQGVIVGDVNDTNLWHDSGTFEGVVFCASTGGGGLEEYRKVYRWGANQMHARKPDARRIFVSSTSVYGQTDGGWVDENSPTIPASETSQVLVEAERTAIEVGAIVLRSAGIYGPGRAALFEKFSRGDAVLEGDGLRWVNQIHRDDLAAAIIHLLDQDMTGEIYNAADDEPVTLKDYYAWCGGKLGKPMPPQGERDANRKRGVTNKRVSNCKLRGTGWEPRYRTFREGLADRFS